MPAGNGICKRDTKGVRQHDIVEKTDGEGRIFKVCSRCGSLHVRLDDPLKKK